MRSTEFIIEKIWTSTHLHWDPDVDGNDPSYVRRIQSVSKPTVTQLAKTWGAKGAARKYRDDKGDGGYWAYAGRCFEFTNQLYHAMSEVGYRGQKKMDTEEWYRHGKKNDKDFKKVLQDSYRNMHSWIMYQGKHYDSMNPEGVDHPSQLKFFKDILRKGQY